MIKASFSYLAHFKWQMHSIIVLLEIVQQFFLLLISLITKLHGKILLSLNFVISPLHLKKKKKKYRSQYLSLPLGDLSALEKLIDFSFLFLPAHFF